VQGDHDRTVERVAADQGPDAARHICQRRPRCRVSEHRRREEAPNRSSICSAGGRKRSRSGPKATAGIVIDNNGTILTKLPRRPENAIKVTVRIRKRARRSTRRVVARTVNDSRCADSHPTVYFATRHARNSSGLPGRRPRLASANPISDLERTLTTGVHSGCQRQITAPKISDINNVLQTDAPIKTGDKSSAAARRIRSRDRDQLRRDGAAPRRQSRIGFAVQINTAKSEISQREGGRSHGATSDHLVDRSTVSLSDMT